VDQRFVARLIKLKINFKVLEEVGIDALENGVNPHSVSQLKLKL
jgi:hypothetical protein